MGATNDNHNKRRTDITSSGCETKEENSSTVDNVAIIDLASPAAYWQALTPVVLDAFLPKGHCATHRSVSIFNSWHHPWSQASQTAVEAVGLFQLAAGTNDHEVLHNARDCLVMAIGKYRKEPIDPDHSYEAVTTAARALMLTEIYTATSSHASDYRVHLEALRGKTRQETTTTTDSSVFGLFLKRSLRAFTYLHGLIGRHSIDLSLFQIFSSPENEYGSIEGLMVLARLIPSQLARADAALSSSYFPKENLWEMATDLQGTVAILLQWLSGSLYCDRLRNPYFLKTKDNRTNVLDKRLYFEDFGQALTFTLHWTCSLLIRECLIDVYQALGLENQHNLAEQNDTYAELLCQSISYLKSECEGSMCQVATCRSPLYFARRWYERRNYQQGMGWCTHQEQVLKRVAPYLRWDLILPFGLFTAPWMAT
ncbi:Hypothetical protein D9617_28g065350 [Elsinoe fawcettii]|nr:Hypothetical protein D9617_28g065350 [Elsinoe fawcettii]